MTSQLVAIKTAFDEAKIPYAYNMFPTDDGSPALPYVTGYVRGGQGSPADDQNYYDTMNVYIVLFTKTKDPTTEELVKDTLKTLEVVYEWEETYDPNEKMYVITYQFTMDA